MLIQADDLTGAADAAAPLLAPGRRVTVVPWSARGDGPMSLGGVIDNDVVAVDTASRGQDARTARTRAASAARSWLACGGDDAIMFKKVDSRLRGHVAAELDGVLSVFETIDGRRGLTVVAPALPAEGRTTVDGVQLSDDRPVNGPASEGDPIAPPPHSRILDVLPPRLHHVVRLSLRDLSGGHIQVAERLTAEWSCGTQAIVADAAAQADLEVIAGASRLSGLRTLLVGSAGLARALAPPGAGARPDLACRRGSRLVLSISATRTARDQVSHLRRTHPDVTVVALDVSLLTGAADRRQNEIAAAAAALQRAVSGGHDLVLTVAGRARAGMPVPDVAAAIRDAVIPVLGLVAQGEPPSLIVANGGDAAAGICEAFDVDHLDVGGELEPGVVLSAAGRRGGAPLPLVTKSGGFGDDATLVRVLDATTAVAADGRP